VGGVIIIEEKEVERGCGRMIISEKRGRRLFRYASMQGSTKSAMFKIINTV
jgi:hypothetical protein